MKCPKDGNELVERVYEGDVHVDGCETCGGIWLDHGELERIQDTLENDYSEELSKLPNFAGNSYEFAKSRNEGDIACPKCGAEMFKHEYASSSNVMIDFCPPCLGTWLDGGEMKKIEIFFERNRKEVKEDEDGNGHLASSFFASLLNVFKK